MTEAGMTLLDEGVNYVRFAELKDFPTTGKYQISLSVSTTETVDDFDIDGGIGQHAAADTAEEIVDILNDFGIAVADWIAGL
jgi:LDH2 family malate/lactate/ureidoglycolate dehydrogenase